MFALFCVPWAANAQETLTVCDGTSTSSNAPIKGSGGSQTEFIYPASLLGDMEGGTITSVKFFSSSTSTTTYSNTVTVFVEEVASSTISASAWQYNQSTATKVYEGTTLTVSNGELVINFDTPFEYNGGNLCFNIWSADNTPSVYYYYLNTPNSCAYDYYITPPVSVPYTTGSNLPKAEFTYTVASGTCEKPATLEYSNLTSSSVDLSWTGGSGVYNIELNDNIIEQSYQGSTYNLTNLEAATSYTVKVQSVCGEETSGSKTVNFTTPCDAVTTFPWSENFESYSSGNFTDPCWVNEHISGNGTQIFKVYNTSTNGSNSTHQLQLPDMSSGTMTKLRLPEMTLSTGDSYLFSIDVYRVNATSYTGEGIRVYASTDGEIEGATELAFISRNFGTGDGNLIPAESAADWYTYELPIPFTGTCYIVLRGESKYGSATYMDNFKVKKELPCVKPSDPTFVSSTTTSATLSWTNGAEGQTAWQIAYSTNPNFNPDEVTPVDVTSNPGTINGLTASTNYYAYVRANCGDLGYSEWSTAYCQFATACEAFDLESDDFTENFDDMTAPSDYTPTEHSMPVCWNVINTCSYSSYMYYPTVTSYGSNSNSGSNYLRFYSYYSSWSDYDPQDQYAILPEMIGLNGMQVTLMAKGSSNTSTFKIGTMSDLTDVGTFQLIAEQALTTSYDEYSFIVNQEGNYLAIMIDAANESRTSNGAYIDDISIDNVPTCFKPSSPMLETPSSRTAHTATLKWTNGEEGQSAWQIAYSTTADFNPDEVTPVDVTTNPATINGLDANTTYYAYVRANCGNGDLSAWSRTKATFTTTVANAAPTGLAVDASSITSESATVTWTGVATNDLHESYDLYFSTEATMPEELVAENLITGITAESYELTHLEAETPYHLWVRDNCGNDGFSAWSSRASFTTASSCQTPDGLAESNVTNESATITWNTYGLTEFNLRYSTDGENWTVEENVNTPYTLGHLTSSTTYQVQVQATCADAETWSNVLSFTTACDAIADLPWNENFDAYTGSTSSSAPTGYPNDELPNCWQFLNRSNSTSNYPQVFISSISGYSVSGKCLFFKSSSSTPLYAVLPSFEEEIAGLQLTFTYRNEGTSASNGTLIVGYMTNPADATTFTEVLTCEKTTALTEMDVLFTNAPAGSYIAFMYQGGSTNNYYMSIDNVKVDFIPTCTKPTALECTATTATSATLRWTAGANENAWQICLNGDETNLIMAESNPFTVEGLTAATAYTAKVRAYCSADDQSDWSNEVSFATLCEAISTFPWTENFNSLTAGIPTCWDNSEGTTTTESYKWNYYATGHDGACLRFNSYNNPNNLTNFLKTVSLSLPSDQLMQLSFWYKNPTGGDFSVYISTDGGATHETALATGLTGASTWTELVISLANYAGQEVVIVFKGTSNYGSGDAYIYLDDVTVMEVPSCLMPTDLAVNYTGGTEATISWTSDAEAWNMRVNGVDVNGVITNPYTLTGLELATTYSVEVQANCGEDGTSEWSNAVSFTTDLCMPENQCEITFELTDSYGDGWNGGAGIRVIDVETNAEIGFMTNEDLDGESGYDFSELNTLTLAVCDGREIQFVWVSGSYDDECSYVVKDANGEVIISGQYAVLLDEPVNYVVNCSAPVPVCTITLDENNEWFQNFDSLTNVTRPSTGVTMGDCWTWRRIVELPINYSDTMPQIYYRSDFANSDDYSLRFWHRGVYAMPELDESIERVQDLQMSFYVRQPYSYYILQVGVMDDPTDPDSFVPVAVANNGSSTDVEYFECNFANYEGTGRYIAFKNAITDATSTDVHSTNYIDDLRLTLYEETTCAPVTLEYAENFENVTTLTTAATGVAPECWEVVSAETDMTSSTEPQVYCKAAYAQSGKYSLRMVNRCVYAMPALDENVEWSDVKLEMYVRQPNKCYQLEVGVWDEQTESFVPVAVVNNSGTGIEEFSCNFSNYSGNGRRIAFRNSLNGGANYAYSYNYIDDITLSLNEPSGECADGISVGHIEDFDNYTTSTIAATGVTPDCWEIVATDVDDVTGSKAPQVYYKNSFATSGSYTLRMVNRCVYAMPEISEGTEMNTLVLIMNVRQPQKCYQLEVGVWEYDENAQEYVFVPVDTINNTELTMTSVNVDFSNYSGNGTRIAFRNSLNSGARYEYSYNYIDDISLSSNEAKVSVNGSENVIDEMLTCRRWNATTRWVSSWLSITMSATSTSTISLMVSIRFASPFRKA